jgi:hypothetical protein
LRTRNPLSYARACAPSRFRAEGDKTGAKRLDHEIRALPESLLSLVSSPGPLVCFVDCDAISAALRQTP